MEKKPRLRAPNFTNSENLLLCDIVTKFKNIIENKRTDGVNLIQKQQTWMKIEAEYNAITTGYKRTLESLQQNYKNLKKKAKKNASSAKMDIPVDTITLIENIEEYGTSSVGWEMVSQATGAPEETCQEVFNNLVQTADKKDKINKKHIMCTGGGPPPKPEEDPLIEKVKGLVGPSIDGFYTIYDGDSTLMASQNTTPIDGQKQEIINCEEPSQNLLYTTPEHQSSHSYFTNDRANLKKKPHVLLNRKRKLESQMPEKQTVADKFKNLAAEKMELVSIQKEILKLQMLDEEEKLKHNRLLRAMEVEEKKEKYAHNKKIREIELCKLDNK